MRIEIKNFKTENNNESKSQYLNKTTKLLISSQGTRKKKKYITLIYERI